MCACACVRVLSEMDEFEGREIRDTDGAVRCKNCKCWREKEMFRGARGKVVAACSKCRAKDARQKQKPYIVQSRNERQREKKYYVAYRNKKRSQDEEGYLRYNADRMKEWRDNHTDQLKDWKNKSVHYNLVAIRQQAKVKGIPWRLSDADATTMMSSPCFYCNRLDDARVNGLDRMCNHQPYDTQNVVACCRFCNMMKIALDARTFVERCRHLANVENNEFAWPSRNALLHGTPFRDYQQRARKKDLAFDFTPTTFLEHRNQPCHYCRLVGGGIDRLDNRQGYTVANCVPCCSECNYMKGGFSEADFRDTCARVAAHCPLDSIPAMPRTFFALEKRALKVDVEANVNVEAEVEESLASDPILS